MYDHFNDLTDSRYLARTAKTSYYWLGDVPLALRRSFIVPSFDRDKNFVFTNAHNIPQFYLLKRDRPTVSYSDTRIAIHNKSLGVAEAFGKFDVVFISNGEPTEERLYEDLLSRGIKDRLHWVKGVKGRTNAYKAAAQASRTHHFFAVFGKLELVPDFSFDFPIHTWDRCHYVYQSLNPINGLQYGHQGAILYDTELVLQHPGNSLDFTMGQPFSALDILSGTAHYNTSALSTWRTAFREVLKLFYYGGEGSIERIAQWKTGEGMYAAESIQGALDAESFFKSHNGSIEALQQSYEWEWLENHFRNTH